MTRFTTTYLKKTYKTAKLFQCYIVSTARQGHLTKMQIAYNPEISFTCNRKPKWLCSLYKNVFSFLPDLRGQYSTCKMVN